MNATIEVLSGDSRKLTVTVPAEKVDSTIKEIYKNAANSYKFPGFRPGKAPRHVIENTLGGRESFIAEATEKVVNATFALAVDQVDARPMGKVDFGEIDDVVEGEDYTYTATYDVRPELELSSYEDFEISLPSAEATDAEVDEQLVQIGEQFASLEPAEDRGVEAGDFVLMSFVGTVDGETYEGNEVDKYLYEMSAGLMPAEFDLGVIGMKPDEQKVIEFTIPDGEGNPEFAGKKAAFDLTVHEIKAKVMPEMNDEFASAVGGFESMDALRTEIASQITTQKTDALSRAKERRAMTMLVDRVEGEAPEALVTEKKDELLKDFYRMLEERGAEFGAYLQAVGRDFDGFQEDMKAQATDLVKEELALEAIFRHQGMEITDAAIDDEFRSAVAGSETITAEELRKQWEDQGMMAMAREGIRRGMAIRWLMDNITVNEELPVAAQDDVEAPVEDADDAKE